MAQSTSHYETFTTNLSKECSHIVTLECGSPLSTPEMRDLQQTDIFSQVKMEAAVDDMASHLLFRMDQAPKNNASHIATW